MMKRLPVPLLIAALGLFVLPPVLLALGLTMTSASEVVTFALACMALNILVGHTGLVSFGHAAYFGVGAYTCAILMKTYGVSFALALAAAAASAAICALVFGLFCVRSTRIYFSMLTLAFAQIVWAICFKWNSVTGGEQGLSNVPYPNLAWMSSIPGLGALRTGDHFYLLVLLLVGLAFWLLRRIVDSPFGSVLTAVRENPERAEFVGVNVRRYQLAAFVVAGAFAGWAGALFGIFNRGVFPDFAHWSKSAEVLIMVILGGISHFWGPAVGAAILILLNQHINAYTQYWPLILGSILIVLVFVFPSGVFGTLRVGLLRMRRYKDA